MTSWATVLFYTFLSIMSKSLHYLYESCTSVLGWFAPTIDVAKKILEACSSAYDIVAKVAWKLGIACLVAGGAVVLHYVMLHLETFLACTT